MEMGNGRTVMHVKNSSQYIIISSPRSTAFVLYQDFDDMIFAQIYADMCLCLQYMQEIHTLILRIINSRMQGCFKYITFASEHNLYGSRVLSTPPPGQSSAQKNTACYDSSVTIHIRDFQLYRTIERKGLFPLMELPQLGTNCSFATCRRLGMHQ